MIEITVKVNDKVSINGIDYDLKDVHITIPKLGLVRADYILHCLYDYENIPNKISLERKLLKYINK